MKQNRKETPRPADQKPEGRLALASERRMAQKLLALGFLKVIVIRQDFKQFLQVAIRSPESFPHYFQPSDSISTTWKKMITLNGTEGLATLSIVWRKDGGNLRPSSAAVHDFSERACSAAQSCPSLCTPRTVAPRLLCPCDSPGKNAGVGCHLLQGIFPTQGLNRVSGTGRQTVYCQCHLGSLRGE